MKRDAADYMIKMKDTVWNKAKCPKHDSSLGPNRWNWVPFNIMRFFSTTKLSCVRVFETEFSEYIISRWRYRTYGKAEQNITKEISVKKITITTFEHAKPSSSERIRIRALINPSHTEKGISTRSNWFSSTSTNCMDLHKFCCLSVHCHIK